MYVNKDASSHLKNQTRVTVISVLIVEAINLFAYVFAAYLLFYEHVRKQREAWYTHRFFVWTNFILGMTHLIIFWQLYSYLLMAMVMIRYFIFLGLMFAQR